MAAEISGLKVTVRVECPRCSAKYEATFVPPPARIVPPAVAVRGLWSPLAPSHRDPSGAGGRGVIVLARATDRERAALDLPARGGRGAEGPPGGAIAMTEVVAPEHRHVVSPGGTACVALGLLD